MNLRNEVHSEMKFYRCDHCGNIVTFVHASGVPVMCCGQKMTELVPGTSDGAVEKHVPVAAVEGNLVTVQVGSVEHPMLEEHHIEFIAVETNQGSQIKYLKPGEKPRAQFVLANGESLVAVYEYCNLHGMWKA